MSARLRDLRKGQVGGHTVERRKASAGLHEYRLNPAGRASGGELYCYLWPGGGTSVAGQVQGGVG